VHCKQKTAKLRRDQLQYSAHGMILAAPTNQIPAQLHTYFGLDLALFGCDFQLRVVFQWLLSILRTGASGELRFCAGPG
jgi:hypothetical protein